MLGCRLSADTARCRVAIAPATCARGLRRRRRRRAISSSTSDRRASAVRAAIDVAAASHLDRRRSAIAARDRMASTVGGAIARGIARRGDVSAASSLRARPARARRLRVSSRVPFAVTSSTGSAVSPRGCDVVRRPAESAAACWLARCSACTSSVSAPIALRWSRRDRAARESLGEKPRALAFGELGRLDHADLGEQRDLDDELEPLRPERELVVAQIEQRLIAVGS